MKPSNLQYFPYGFPSAINVKQDSCQHPIILEITLSAGNQGRLSSSALLFLGFGRIFSANECRKLSQIAHFESTAQTAANCAFRRRPLKQRIHVVARKLEQRPHSVGNVDLSSNGLLVPICQSDKLPPVKGRDCFGIRCECGSKAA